MQVLVLYASQTGNAEWIAKNFYAELQKKKIDSACLVMDDFTDQAYEKYKQPDCLFIFVSSTTGDGDAPDNALKFWRMIRKVLKENEKPFDGKLFTVLGLGDTNYSSFGAHPKKIEKKMIEMGASIFYPTRVCDEVEGLEGQVEPWMAGLWPVLNQKLGLAEESKAAVADEIIIDSTIKEIQKLTLTEQQKKMYLLLPTDGIDISDQLVLTGVAQPPASLVKVQESQSAQPKQYTKPVEYTYKEPFESHISSCECLTHPEAVKRTLKMSIPIDWDYEPGDAVGVFGPVPAEYVQVLLLRLDLKGDQWVQLKSDNLPSHLPTDSVQIIDLFSNYVDSKASPRKALVRLLADYCTDLTQKKQLLFLCSRQGNTLWKQWTQQYEVTLLDLLFTFTSTRPPLERLLDGMPPIAPRHYSVTASSKDPQGKNKCWFLFNVVDHVIKCEETKTEKRQLGIASSYLDHLSGYLGTSHSKPKSLEDLKKTPIYVFPHPSHEFHLPKDEKVPLIFIGPGTGIAPFLSFLNHLQHTQQQKRDIWMLNGCRHPQKDDYARSLLSPFIKSGLLTRVTYCYSRWTRDMAEAEKQLEFYDKQYEGKYVQDSIRKYGKEMTSWLMEKDAHVFICGDAKNMVKDVQDAFISVLSQYGNMSQMQATEWLMNRIKEKKYLRDVWA